MFFVLQGLILRRTTFKFEYLREFVLEFENVLGYESGGHMGSIHEKTRGQKSRASVLLRELSEVSNISVSFYKWGEWEILTCHS